MHSIFRFKTKIQNNPFPVFHPCVNLELKNWFLNQFGLASFLDDPDAAVFSRRNQSDLFISNNKMSHRRFP